MGDGPGLAPRTSLTSILGPSQIEEGKGRNEQRYKCDDKRYNLEEQITCRCFLFVGITRDGLGTDQDQFPVITFE